MMVKRIYIEGLGLVDGHFSGVGQYILGVLRGIDELLEERKYAGERVPDVRVIIPYTEVAKFSAFGFKHIHHKSFPLSFRLMSALWTRGRLPPLDLWCGPGSYIFTRFVGMPLLFSKSAVVIYDLSYELYRQYSNEANAAFLSKRARKTLDSSKKVITISQNAKKEIVDFYKLNPSNVMVATPATDPRIFYRHSSRDIERAKYKYNIDGDYILALSNLEPRKNLEALVDAYCELPKDVTKNVALLLVGVNGWKTEKLFDKIIKKVEEGYNIIRPAKYVLDKDKAAIISGAKMLVYPSHYEGFGMPPLEALACGTPTITSNNSSLPEVVGQLGAMVDSNNVDELRQCILSYLKNEEEILAASIVKGPERAATFSWVKSGEIFLSVAGEL